MNKFIFRPFWSYDVVKTEQWLARMHQNGYALHKINFKARLFYFTQPTTLSSTYRIVFEKKSRGNIVPAIADSGYESVCYAKNYFVIRSAELNPATAPSYNGFLDKNKKLKFIIGIILLFLCITSVPTVFMVVLAVLFAVMIIFSLISGNFTVEETPPEEILSPTNVSMNGMDAIFFILTLTVILSVFAWLIYTYFKLRKTNKQLESLCGDELDLSFTIPKENFMSKEQEKVLNKEKRLIRKRRIAWVYAPDKLETWLEKMESEGYNLYRMSKLGNSFYFIKGEPKKMKYCFDYQNKAYPQYYNLNKESGWKLIFTSVSRLLSHNLWSQEYLNEPPFFYSDKESKLKQAKRFALTNSICFFPICLLYILLIVMDIFVYEGFSMISWPTVLLWLLLIFEFGFFATRTILYYFRVKKSFEK